MKVENTHQLNRTVHFVLLSNRNDSQGVALFKNQMNKHKALTFL